MEKEGKFSSRGDVLQEIDLRLIDHGGDIDMAVSCLRVTDELNLTHEIAGGEVVNGDGADGTDGMIVRRYNALCGGQ